MHLALHGTDQNLKFKLKDNIQGVDHQTVVDDLIKNDNLKLVILNVCDSARTNNFSETSLAKGLLRRGVIATIGMSSEITDRASYYFSESLYSRMFMGYSLIQSFSLSTEILRNHEDYDKILWSVPMLLQTVDTSLAQLLGQINWPVEYIEELIELIDNFEEAYGKLSKGSIKNYRELTKKTIYLRMILPSLTEHIQNLSKSLPLTMNEQAISEVLNIKNERANAEKLIKYFNITFNELLTPSRNNQLRSDKLSMFFRRGDLLLDKLLELQTLLDEAIY